MLGLDLLIDSHSSSGLGGRSGVWKVGYRSPLEHDLDLK